MAWLTMLALASARGSTRSVTAAADLDGGSVVPATCD